ncbi:hypothetical protein AE10_04912, partial [Escherichia coli UCI 51]
AGNRRPPVFVQQLGDIILHLLLLFIHQTLRQVITLPVGTGNFVLSVS